MLHQTGREAFDAVKMLKNANPAQYTPANGADYPRSPYGEALKQIAQLIKADVGLEIAFAETGNWDHHVNEGAANGQIATRLDDFSRGIAALVQDLGDRMADVVILTMSEFGRAVAENGNRGTDHGHGNAMMIVGGGVRGGRSTASGPASPASSATTAATSPSRPTSARFSPKSSAVISALRRSTTSSPASTDRRRSARSEPRNVQVHCARALQCNVQVLVQAQGRVARRRLGKHRAPRTLHRDLALHWHLEHWHEAPCILHLALHAAPARAR